MAELVYAQHLRCCAARHVGPSPTPGTNFVLVNRARLRTPSGEGSSPQNQWAALCAAAEFRASETGAPHFVKILGLEKFKMMPCKK